VLWYVVEGVEGAVLWYVDVVGAAVAGAGAGAGGGGGGAV
jgi:hypothetical protein